MFGIPSRKQMLRSRSFRTRRCKGGKAANADASLSRSSSVREWAVGAVSPDSLNILSTVSEAPLIRDSSEDVGSSP